MATSRLLRRIVLAVLGIATASAVLSTCSRRADRIPPPGAFKDDPALSGTFHCEVDQSGSAETSYCVGPAPTCARYQSNNCASFTPVDPAKNVRMACGEVYNSAKICLPNK